MKRYFVAALFPLLLFSCTATPETEQATPAPTITIPDPATASPTVVPSASPLPSSTARPSATSIPRPNSCIPEMEPVEAQVVRIIDGDTIEVAVAGAIERVRLIGIDTPERGEAGFYGATEYTSSLVNGKTVNLWQDVSDRDRYNRLLAYVTVGQTFVNLNLVREGYAVPYRYPPDTSCSNLFDAVFHPTATPRPYVAPTLPASSGNTCENRVFANCTEVRNAGCAPVYSYQSWYRSKFDRDKDGIGCE